MQNKRAVVRGHEIIVSLDNPNGTGSVFVKAPCGKGTHKVVDLGPLLVAGVSIDAALQTILGAVSIGLEGFIVGNG